MPTRTSQEMKAFEAQIRSSSRRNEHRVITASSFPLSLSLSPLFLSFSHPLSLSRRPESSRCSRVLEKKAEQLHFSVASMKTIEAFGLAGWLLLQLSACAAAAPPLTRPNQSPPSLSLIQPTTVLDPTPNHLNTTNSRTK